MFFDNHKKNKLNDNGKYGIFLGYSIDSTGYHIFDVETKNIVTSINVVFAENIPGTINTSYLLIILLIPSLILNLLDLQLRGKWIIAITILLKMIQKCQKMKLYN